MRLLLMATTNAVGPKGPTASLRRTQVRLDAVTSR